MNLEYSVGDILLASIGYLKECEIEGIAGIPECMKIDGTWYNSGDITPNIRAVLGRANYKKGLFGVKRTVVYI